MRMGELVGRTVLSADGRTVGVVSDVRLVQDGPILANGAAALRVDALVVGRRGLAVRLGYVRGGVRGPWLLRSVSRAIEGRARFVRWADVAGAGGDGDPVTLAVTAAAVPRLRDAV
jgi:hypothetical protein